MIVCAEYIIFIIKDRMFLDKMQQLIDVVDDNKDVLSEIEYLKLCNLMKEIYSCHENTTDEVRAVEDSYEMSYRQSEMLKCFLNILVISTNISTIILLYISMNKTTKI